MTVTDAFGKALPQPLTYPFTTGAPEPGARTMTNKLLIATTLGLTGLLGAHLYEPATARAQSNTTGAIQGTVTDSKTGEKLAGVTCNVSSASLQGVADGDHRRERLVQDLAAAAGRVPRDVLLPDTRRSSARRQRRHQQDDAGVPEARRGEGRAAGGEIVKIDDTAPTIDPTSTTQGVTIDKNYMKNMPVPGRTFEAALGAAAGSQNDGARRLVLRVRPCWSTSRPSPVSAASAGSPPSRCCPPTTR